MKTGPTPYRRQNRVTRDKYRAAVPPAAPFAGVVKLRLLRDAQILPACPEEPEDLVHAARAGEAQADGAIEGILSHPDVVASATPLEVDRPHQVHLMELVLKRNVSNAIHLGKASPNPFLRVSRSFL
jgi:hypothetical protein